MLFSIIIPVYNAEKYLQSAVDSVLAQKNTDHELIIAVCEQGYSETVMDAAKKADAGGGSSPMNISSDGHASQISDLAEAILTGRKPFLDGREGRRAIELICGIYESARTGKPYYFNR